MIYLYQKRITLLHEYISDDIVSKKEAKEIYINNLLSKYFQVENISFVNQFYKQTLIKKRILMMTKKQSKKMNQLKYLLLIPVLASMLFYISCAESVSKYEVTSGKKIKTLYRNVDGKLASFKGNRMSYLDNYIGSKPPWEEKEISFEELSKEEQNEFNDNENDFEGNMENVPEFFKPLFFKMPNGRNAHGVIMKDLISFSKTTSEIQEISFLKMERTPTFLGCEERNQDCFLEKIEKHFNANFDREIIKDIFMSFGEKKFSIAFSIDEKGNVVNVSVSGPHIVIEQEVLEVMNSLPKMIPREQDGKTVAVKYSIPLAIIAE